MAAYYNEHEPYAAAWLRNLIEAGHIAPGDVDERDIALVDAADLTGYSQCHFFAGIGVWSLALRQAGWPDDLPVWTGSCPCQPFSGAGKKLGFNDHRHLWPVWFQLIAKRRPPVVFGEQVASGDGLRWLDTVHADLEDAGYAVGAADLCAAGVGAPHIRQRLYFVADAAISGRREECTDAGGSRGGGEEKELEQRSECRSDGVLADAGSARRRQRQEPGEGSGTESIFESYDGQNARLRQPERVRATGLVGYTDSARPQERQGQADGRRIVRIEGQAAAEAGVVGGFWRSADLIWCRDGKYRAVEPGTFPLAHGITNRVGRLRATGNAIVAPLAEAFVRAYLTR